MIDIIDLSTILYYADYLAIRNSSRQVTDNCKYYCLYGAPINLAYLHDSLPFYDVNDKYYILAYEELKLLEDKAGPEAVREFVNSICNLKVMGCIDPELMLKQVHQFSNNIERKTAYKDYYAWLNTQYYSHLQTNELGDLERKRCSRYIAHSEYGTEFQPQVEYINPICKDGFVEKRIQNYSGATTEIKKV